MTRIGKQILGAKGLDTKNSPFLIDPLRSTVAENFLVSTNSRKKSPGCDRWLYDKYIANGMRFYGFDRLSWLTAIDPTNEVYNTFDPEGTIEFRIRLHSSDGPTYMQTIPVISRDLWVYGLSQPNFQVTLENVGASGSETDEYYVRVSFYETSLRQITTTVLKIDHDNWYHIAIVRNGTDILFYKDGAHTETIASGTSFSATQGNFSDEESKVNHGDIVIGASTLLDERGNFDLDELRVWSDVRTPTEIVDNYDKELDDYSSETELLCYINFEENTGTQQRVTDKINPTNSVFLGGILPFEEDDNLVFQGSYNTPSISSLATSSLDINLLGLTENNVGEIAFIPLKAKKGFIAGDSTSYLQLTYDGSSKWRVSFTFDDNGTPTTIEPATGFLDTTDFDGTTIVYCAVRNDTANTTVELWINGAVSASYNYGAGPINPPTSTNLGQDGSNDEWIPYKLKWIRIFRDSRSTDYMQNKYNVEITDADASKYRHKNVSINYPIANKWGFSGYGTTWPNNLQYSAIGFKEALKFIGFDNGESAENFNQGAQTVRSIGPSGSWAVADAIQQSVEIVLTNLFWKFDKFSFKNFTYHKSLGGKVFPNNSDIKGDVVEGVPEFHIISKGNISGTGYTRVRDEGPEYISSTTKLTNLKPVRYIGEYQDRDNIIDSLVVIVGTALLTIDKTTKEITEHNVNILPNEDVPFTSALLDRQLYLTDGKTKLHLYTYEKELKVRKWSFYEFNYTNTSTPTSVTGTGQNKELQYLYCFYNREIDQYSGTCFLNDAGTGLVIDRTSGAVKANVLQNYESEFDYIHRATDIVMLRTKDLNGGEGFSGEFYILDYVGSHSTGYIDWETTDNNLDVLYPVERVGVGSLNPPNGTIVVEHAGRLFVLGGDAKDKFYFNAIDLRLHSPTIKSETYCFPPDHFWAVPGNRDLTGAISFGGGLFIFTIDSMHLFQGTNLSNFALRKLHEGIGCIAHRTILNVGGFFVWMGNDDIYVSSGGQPKQLDQEGKIREYIKNELDPDLLKDSFAVYDKENQLLEFHVAENTGSLPKRQVILTFDLISSEVTIRKDMWASCGSSIIETSGRSKAYYGTTKGFIVKSNADSQMYQPPSGALRTTVSSFNSSTSTITVPDSLYTSEAGIIGNTVYIVKQGGSAEGSILKTYVESNTEFTLTYEFGDIIFGDNFVPSSTDIVIVGAPVMRFKTGISSTKTQTGMQQASYVQSGGEVISDIVSREILDISFLHEIASSDALCFFRLYRELDTVGESILQVKDMDKVRFRAFLNKESLSQFLEIEVVFIHESDIFDFIGFIMGENLIREDFHS